MKYFDFSDIVAQEVFKSDSLVERLTVRTRVGREQLPAALKRAHVRQLQMGDELDLDTAHVLVVGIATWSDPDLEALDKLVCDRRTRNVLIAVFDIDDCTITRDIHRFMPGVPAVINTPVVAQYRQGTLVFFDQGKSAIYGLAQF